MSVAPTRTGHLMGLGLEPPPTNASLLTGAAKSARKGVEASLIGPTQRLQWTIRLKQILLMTSFAGLPDWSSLQAFAKGDFEDVPIVKHWCQGRFPKIPPAPSLPAQWINSELLPLPFQAPQGTAPSTFSLHLLHCHAYDVSLMTFCLHPQRR